MGLKKSDGDMKNNPSVSNGNYPMLVIFLQFTYIKVWDKSIIEWEEQSHKEGETMA